MSTGENGRAGAADIGLADSANGIALSRSARVPHPARSAAERYGDANGTALAESVIELFKTEVIQRLGAWRHLDNVEFATLTWVDLVEHAPLARADRYEPPPEYEAQYYEEAAVA